MRIVYNNGNISLGSRMQFIKEGHFYQVHRKLMSSIIEPMERLKNNLHADHFVVYGEILFNNKNGSSMIPRSQYLSTEL
jgi:hypothetical protein